MSNKFNAFLNKLDIEEKLKDSIKNAHAIIFEDLCSSGHGMGMIAYDDGPDWFEDGDYFPADINDTKHSNHGHGAKHSHLSSKSVKAGAGANSVPMIKSERPSPTSRVTTTSKRKSSNGKFSFPSMKKRKEKFTHFLGKIQDNKNLTESILAAIDTLY